MLLYLNSFDGYAIETLSVIGPRMLILVCRWSIGSIEKTREEKGSSYLMQSSAFQTSYTVALFVTSK